MKENLRFKIFGVFVLMLTSLVVNAQKVTLDNFYNKEVKKDKAGNEVRFRFLMSTRCF